MWSTDDDAELAGAPSLASRGRQWRTRPAIRLVPRRDRARRSPLLLPSQPAGTFGFGLCPRTRRQRRPRPGQHLLGVIEQAFGYPPVGIDFDGPALGLVAERRQPFGFVVAAVAVID